MIDSNRRYVSAAVRQSGNSVPSSAAAALTALTLAVIVNLMVLANVNLPIVRPVLGFWLVIVFPSYLVFTSSVWRKCSLQERLGYSLCSVLLILMLVGLIINEALPAVGVQRPLDTGSILIVSDLINISLFVFRSRNPDRIRLRTAFIGIGKEEMRLLVGAALTVILAVLGANHLNNGASDKIAIIALALMALVGGLSVRWMKFTRESVMLVVIYLVSLGLLLTTSLRGWYVTGHDIQQEYLVFQLTQAHAHWSMSYFHDPYNACLSIAILPTELEQIINVDSPYVFKLFFQLIFALCPVLAYGIARRYFNRGVATLSVAYFVSFPTFFTDMPFLNRQEIALLFVAVGLLAATNPVWTFRRRQISLGIAGLGTEISHYSTMYVFVGTLVFALVLSYTSRLFIKSDRARIRPNSAQFSAQRGGRRWVPTTRGAVTVGLIVAFICIIFAWGTLVTKTTTQVLSDGKAALSAGSISLSVLPGATNSEATILSNLRQEGLQIRAESPMGTYLPWSAVTKVAVPVVNQPLTPLTTIGSDLNSVGIPVSALNSIAHSLEADGEELFLVVGLVSLFIGGWRRGRVIGGQFYWLSAGCTAMIVLITVVPSISADYGVLRAFQQGLLFFSPMIVTGSMTLFSRLGQRRSRFVACSVCLGVFLLTTTLIPQLLGNNQAQLNLNNSGYYYDLYYKTSQETAAVTWLDEQPDALHYPVQGSWDTRRFLFTGPSVVSGIEQVTDEYPTLVYQKGWVMLDHSTTTSGTAFSLDLQTGDMLEYKYPQGLLSQYKNLVYTNGGSIIYK
jgi:uncharacterized membrane protein